MKIFKKGYTLAEILIALAIVGVISAVMLPLVNKYKPDTEKVMYLKTYDTLLTSIKSIVYNTTWYPTMDEENNVDYSKNPLTNLKEVELQSGKKASGTSKLCQILGWLMSKDDPSCTTSYSGTYNANMFNNKSFKAQNGVEFYITTNKTNNIYETDIYFDVNGKGKGPDCMYDPSKCAKPDRFLIKVIGNGALSAYDKAGSAYLDKRMNWKKEDLVGKEIVALDTHYQNEQITTTEDPPNRPDTYTYDCLTSYVGSDPGYNVYDSNGNLNSFSGCPNGTLQIETEDHNGTFREAHKKCTELGGRLPTTHELSAAGRFSEQLGLSTGNYWSLYYLTDLNNEDPLTNRTSARNCYMPTGNCGLHSPSDKQNFRCVFD